MLDRPSDLELRAAQDHFGFRLLDPLEKDWYVVQAMARVLSVDADPFRLVFAGGTCLARAHRLVDRMSEDVDFKVVPPEAPMSNNQRRLALGGLRDRLIGGLTRAGFALAQEPRSRDANQCTVLHLRPEHPAALDGPLRSTIQIELSWAELRQPTALRAVASFVSQAFGRQPELDAVECVSVDETAAEKLVSLTRRTAMELAGASRAPDPTLVRHIYDLHRIDGQMDRQRVARLIRAVAEMDAEQFARQHPAYRGDTEAETRKALAHLRSNPAVRAQYETFVAAMVYGMPAPFDEAMRTVQALVEHAWPDRFTPPARGSS
jgi:predicted nucleotidyltransferase component of viral defense system